jgi:hypothetical protein
MESARRSPAASWAPNASSTDEAARLRRSDGLSHIRRRLLRLCCSYGPFFHALGGILVGRAGIVTMKRSLTFSITSSVLSFSSSRKPMCDPHCVNCPTPGVWVLLILELSVAVGRHARGVRASDS